MRFVKIGLAAAILFGAVMLTSQSASAQASVNYYRGPHAVPSEYGGFCNITVRHFHTYKPDDMKVFRLDSDTNTYAFLGDPTAHGFAGPKISFYGHHRIPNAWGGNWCFIAGPHYHFYRPVGSGWNYHGGVYYWAGGYTDPWYIRNRTIYEPIFNTYYATRPGYIRPVLYAPPPRMYVGPRVVVPVAPWRGATVRVGAPSIRVGGPAVRVGGPGVRVGGPGMGAPMGRPGMVPGAPMGKAPMGAPMGRPGMAPMGKAPMGAPMGRPGMAPMGKAPMGPAARPMPAAKAPPSARPMPPAKAAPGPRPMPAAKAGPAPRPAPAARPAPAPRPAPAARPAPRPAPGKRP